MPAGPADPKWGLESYLRAEQLSLLTRSRVDQYASIVTAGITVAVVWRLYPSWLLELWFGITCGVVFLRAFLAHRCNAAELTAQSVRRWVRVFTGFVAIISFLWGAAATSILLTPNLAIQFYVIMTTGGLMTGGVTGNAASRPTMIGCGLAAQLPVIFALLAVHDSMHSAVAVMLAVFTAFILNAGLKFNRVISDNIRMRFSQQLLLAKVQSSETAMAEAQRLGKTGSWVRDLKTNVISLSPEAYSIFGIDPANLTPDFGLITARVHPDDDAVVEACVTESMTTGGVASLDHRLVMDNATIKYLHISAKTVFGASGQPVQVIGSVQDVTDRRLIENRLQSANILLNTEIAEKQMTEERLQFTNILLNTQMEASRDGILVVDKNNTIIAVNKRYGKHSKARFDDLVGQDLTVAVDRVRALLQDQSALRQRAASVAANATGISEAEFGMADGRFISRYTTPLRAPNGDYLGRAFFYSDVTDRRQSAEALAYRDRLLHTVTAATAVAVGALSLADGVTAALAKIGEIMGIERVLIFREEPDQMPPLALLFGWESPAAPVSFKLFGPGAHQFDPTAMAEWRAPLAAGKPVIAQRETATGAVLAMMEHYGTQSSLLVPVFVGGAQWGFLGIDACAAPREWAASEIETVGILADVTGSLIVRERARVALESSEQRFRLLTSTAQDAVMLTNEAAVIQKWNNAAEQMLGYTADEAIGRNVVELILPRRRAAEIAAVLSTVTENAGITMEIPVRCKDGSERAVEIAISAARLSGKLEFITIMRDISERKLAEQKLQFNNILLSTQMDASLDGIMVVSSNWTMVSCNQRLSEIWRLTEEHTKPGGDEARRAHILAQVAAPEADKAIIKYLMDHPDKIGRDEVATTDGRTIERYSRGLTSPAGQHFGRVWFFRDVTARKTAEQKLQFTNILLNTQMEASPDGILVVDATRKMVSCNQRFAEIWRMPAALVTPGQDDARRTHILAQVADPQAYAARIDHLVAHPDEIGEDELITTDGRTLERYTRTLVSAAGEYLGRVWFFGDVTDRKLAERKLVLGNALMQTQLEASPDGIYVVGVDRQVLSYNQRFVDMFSLSKTQMVGAERGWLRREVGKRLTDAAAFEDRIAFLNLHPGETANDVLETLDGRIIEQHSVSLLAAGSGQNLGRAWFYRDTTERRRAELKLLLANTLMKTQMEASPDGVYVIGPDREILSYNQRFAEMFQVPEADFAGPAAKVRSHIVALLKDPRAFEARLAHLYANPNESLSAELETRDGRIIELLTVSLQAEAQDLGRAWFVRDVTARRAADSLALRLARQDVLTGLANRAVFVEAVQQAIAHARRDGAGFAVLYLDLDHFKDVNDTLGHPAGDALLKGVAGRLLAATRETDTVGRFGGDEFAVILSGIQNATEAGILAEKLIAAINIPLVIELNTVHVRASIGIELFSPYAEDSETLLAHADVALYRAKAEGRGTFRFFTAAMDRDVRGRVTLGTELREALGAGELFLLYQPQVEAMTGRLLGVEALIRWRHPTRGILLPETFIAAAETTGAITQLGRFVLWAVCRQAGAWRDAGLELPRISFNVSALQFKGAAALEADIAEALTEFSLPARILELELTESVLMDSTREDNNILRRLKNRGVKLAIDDFGTGYSSLEYLRRFPADHIKIAQSFTKNIETEASDASIVRAIIGLANELNIATIAEGIETRVQMELIASWGCTQMQGYYFSRPVAAEEITTILQAGGMLGPATQSRPLSWPDLIHPRLPYRTDH
jgi:diguanylate cyclase (GGDEF)-like protein/PAS domain S-box-containing protein